MIQLKTRWADAVSTVAPLSEYPRPAMACDSYFNLNGQWKYAVSSEAAVNGKMVGGYTISRKR